MSDNNTVPSAVPSRPYWETKREELARDWEKIKNNFFVNMVLPLQDLSEGNTEALIPYVIPGGGVARQAVRVLPEFFRKWKVAKEINKMTPDVTKVATKVPAAKIVQAEPVLERTTKKVPYVLRQRPLTEAEKAGIPKAERIMFHTPEEDAIFRKQINDFAQKYGYAPVPENITSGEALERYARDMIAQHNSFYRGVQMPTRQVDIDAIKSVLGETATDEQILQYVATHPRKGDALFFTPYQNASAYGDVAVISRPYSLGPDRTQWFIKGDYPIYQAGGIQGPIKGISDPWTRPLFGQYTADSKDLYQLVRDDFIPQNSNAVNELVSYDPLIFRNFVTEKGSELPQLSRNINFHPWQEIVFQRKGGPINYLQLLKKGCSIHIKPENKGKFTETKKRTGKTTEELTHSKNPITRKRAIFAQNAAKWHH